MSRAIRFVVAALLFAPALAGCGPSKQDATPNPDLKVPEIPASGHGSKGELKDTKDKKGK